MSIDEFILKFGELVSKYSPKSSEFGYITIDETECTLFDPITWVAYKVCDKVFPIYRITHAGHEIGLSNEDSDTILLALANPKSEIYHRLYQIWMEIDPC